MYCVIQTNFTITEKRNANFTSGIREIYVVDARILKITSPDSDPDPTLQNFRFRIRILT
jgi:hypothetical protein